MEESLVADRGCVPETSGERHHKGSEGAVLNFPNSLLIGTYFDVFMLSIASGEGLAVGNDRIDAIRTLL